MILSTRVMKGGGVNELVLHEGKFISSVEISSWPSGGGLSAQTDMNVFCYNRKFHISRQDRGDPGSSS